MRTKPSAWEAICVSEMRKRCESTASSIGGLDKIGMNREDAVQQMLMQVVEACRLWAVDHEDKPDSQYLGCAVRRRKLKLWTKIREAGAKAVYPKGADGEPVQVDQIQSDNPSPEEEASSLEGMVFSEPWLAILRHTLDPSEYAILDLRSKGWKNREIALATGEWSDPDDIGGVIRRKYWATKKKASDFLKSCGIGSLEAALNASTEIRDAAWEKAVEKTVGQS